MLEYLRGKASQRKLRLVAVACCRRVRHLLTPEACQALEVAERVAEGLAGSEERRRVREAAFHADWLADPTTAHRRGPAKAAVCDALARRGWEAAASAVWRTIQIGTLETYRSHGEEWEAARKAQGVLLAESLRCLFGNPFRPLSLAPAVLAWQGSTVVKMASTIYEARRWEDMPLLGDALEEAGCSDRDVLEHCRGKGPHARGCFVLDSLLDRE